MRGPFGVRHARPRQIGAFGGQIATEEVQGVAPAVHQRFDPGLLTGREKGRPRTELLTRLAAGEIDILIGTHALFQDDVTFRDLAVAVIDEQHRFGVHQRLALQSKGGSGGANVLVMTATPIPRTLLMTHYGDLDVSRLTEKPAGRKPVVTTKASVERIEDVIDGLRRALGEGAQVYWVCPLIESSEKSELAAAEERPWQLDGLLADRADRLLYVELKGTCPPEALDELLAAIGRPAEGFMFQLVREAVFLDEEEFRRYAAAPDVP